MLGCMLIAPYLRLLADCISCQRQNRVGEKVRNMCGRERAARGWRRKGNEGGTCGAVGGVGHSAGGVAGIN